MHAACAQYSNSTRWRHTSRSSVAGGKAWNRIDASRPGCRGIGASQHFDQVDDPDLRAPFPRAAPHVEQAARIRRDHDLGARLLDRVELVLELALGHLGMSEVVDAGAAATP